jgi:hypothetical protein
MVLLPLLAVSLFAAPADAAERGVTRERYVGNLKIEDQVHERVNDSGSFTPYKVEADDKNMVFTAAWKYAPISLSEDAVHFPDFNTTQTVSAPGGECTATYQFDPQTPTGNLGSFSETGGKWHVQLDIGIEDKGTIVSSSNCGPNNVFTTNIFGKPPRTSESFSVMGTYDPATGKITFDTKNADNGTQTVTVTGTLKRVP